ncbi:MAG: hypothetical protein KAH07_01875 [Flavobacteriaceae bacterium]|nr:hypothetical protein [Flavobacteriaceae bacterium]
MKLEIITPEATLINTEVNSVTVPGINGSFQMLDNHAPIVSFLAKGNVKFNGGAVNIEEEFQEMFTKKDGDYLLAIKSGTIEMRDNKVIILAD